MGKNFSNKIERPTFQEKFTKELDFVIYEKDKEIASLTFNRPERMNAFWWSFDYKDWEGRQYARDIQTALDMAENDDEVKVLIIKGAGKAFSSGYDISRVYHVYEDADEEPGKRRPSQRIRLNFDRKWGMDNLRFLLFPKVTIAQVHGIAIGEGATIAEMCDITIVGEDAQISHAEQRLGFSGSGEFIVPLYQLLGFKKTREMLLTGDTYTGKQAAEMGWANKCVPNKDLDAEVMNTARKIALLPKDGLSIGKASHHWILDILGLTKGWCHSYVTHAYFTNSRFEKGEFSFIRDREKENGGNPRDSFHKRDELFAKAGSGAE